MIIEKGKLLIAEPSIIGDLSFNRSIILIVEHNSNGSIGFIMNKPLNVKLSDIANVLERAEKLIWKMWFDWEQIVPDEEFDIYYEKKFDLRDKHQEVALYEKAKNLVPNSSFQNYINEEFKGCPAKPLKLHL